MMKPTDIAHTFSKAEKLCSTKSIDMLFLQGVSFIAYPLRVVFLIKGTSETSEQNVSILVSVPKKKIKQAVKRNKVKRLIREAYRLNKVSSIQLLKDRDRCVDIAFLYLKNEVPDFAEIEKAVTKALSMITAKIEENKMK